jgi:hypothetical protein
MMLVVYSIEISSRIFLFCWIKISKWNFVFLFTAPLVIFKFSFFFLIAAKEILESLEDKKIQVGKTMERERRDFLLWYFGCFSLWICLTLYGIPIWAAAGTFELLLPFHIWPRTNCLIRYVFVIIFLASLPRTNFHFFSNWIWIRKKEKMIQKRRSSYAAAAPLSRLSLFSFRCL